MLTIVGTCIAQRPIIAQPSKSTIKIVLIRNGANGLSVGQANSFFSSLAGKLSKFEKLSISSKENLAAGLNKEGKDALNKCSDLNCIRPIAAKAGFRQLLLCAITKKNSSYAFQAYEYDVARGQIISQLAENATCSTAADVENFTRELAVKIGQTATGGASVPEALQESKSNLWWYIGSAVTVGVAGGIYYAVSRSKETSSTPTSLPAPPSFP